MREAAARLAAILPRERLEPAVLAWIAAAARRTAWAVACSGGADSVALLMLLWAHWPDRRRHLRVLHFDHRLRGRASTADAAFCRRLARLLGVRVRVGRWGRPRVVPSEAEARAARLAFLHRHARVVFLGHQQDDIAESMLMRLARGSGSGGLAAPRPVQRLAGGRVHLRPLLPLKKAEIVAALRQAGVPWREDATNEGDAHFRNRIRHRVMPAWGRAAQRDALGGAARSRQLLEEDDAALESWLEELAPLDRRGGLDHGRLAGKPRALLRRALHRWLLTVRPPVELSRQAFDALLAALEAGRATRHSLGRHGFAVTDGKVLRFQSAGMFRRKFQRGAN